MSHEQTKARNKEFWETPWTCRREGGEELHQEIEIDFIFTTLLPIYTYA